MKPTPLPKHLEPLKLSERGAQLKGSIAISQLPRLRESLAEASGVVEVELGFGRDKEGLNFIRGTLAATLSLICQRCLQVMDYPLQIAISLSPIRDENSAKNLPESYEPLLLDADGIVLLADLVEEELLLGLPLVAKHEKNCADG